MSQPKTKLMLCLVVVDTGAICGNRLERQGVPLPAYRFMFNDTPEGRKEALEVQENMEGYMAKYHAVPKKSSLKAQEVKS